MTCLNNSGLFWVHVISRWLCLIRVIKLDQNQTGISRVSEMSMNTRRVLVSPSCNPSDGCPGNGSLWLSLGPGLARVWGWWLLSSHHISQPTCDWEKGRKTERQKERKKENKNKNYCDLFFLLCWTSSCLESRPRQKAHLWGLWRHFPVVFLTEPDALSRIQLNTVCLCLCASVMTAALTAFNRHITRSWECLVMCHVLFLPWQHIT